MSKPTKQQLTLVKRLHLLAKKMFSGDFSTPMFSSLYSEMNGVSIINIDGELGKKLSNTDKANGMIDVDDIVTALKIADKANTNVTLLVMNSPGGSSTGIEETGNVIKKMAATKPIFAFTDTICASAAYWLASCCNGIYVTPSSEIGSIGVFAKVIDYSESLKLQGINVQVFSAGNMKTMGQPERPLNDEETKFIQDDINKQYAKFTSLVKDNRGNVKDEVMQGQLFSGNDAIETNLADEVIESFDVLLEEFSTIETEQ